MKEKAFIELVASDSDTLLLDIREADELTDDNQIEGAVHMPMGKVFREAAQDQLPKDKAIVVFCRSGMRAAVVARELTKSGYMIDGLEGGLNSLGST